ncbi:restriction endonuclease subunit S [Acinetobacter sp. c1-l78]|uniref:restriction endonuclease subunit S n=1 Tax=Acinetobacter sp. c1-l78 TaxID=3342803 RepID=UPI0035B77A57
MQTKLKNIAYAYSGMTMRTAVDQVDDGDSKLLQGNNLSADQSSFDASNLTKINQDSNRQTYLKHNSIVVINRGKPVAYLFTGSESDKVIVSHLFSVIELSSETTATILPAYLVWYINNALVAKSHFEKNSQGVHLMMTSINTIKRLPIVIPSIAEQQQILEREEQSINEQALFESLIKLRQEYNHALNQQVITDAQQSTFVSI